MKDKGPPASDFRVEWALIGCALLGLAFSALLHAEYRLPGSSGLCNVAGGGCDAVRLSAYSSIGGIQVPDLGIAYFLALLAVTMLPALRPVLVPFAVLGGAVGLAFIGLQAFVIGAFCPLCLVVDLSAIGAAALAVQTRGRKPPAWSTARGLIVGALTLIAVLLSVPDPTAGRAGGTAPVTPVESLPDMIAEMQQAAPITVVEFADFQCPACRYQYGVFDQLRERVDYDITFVYLMAPLPQHEYADGAARAYLCAAEQDSGPAMAHALFTADPPSAEVAARTAEDLSLDTQAFASCLHAPRTEQRLALDARRSRQVGLRSLPTFWIGSRMFVGTAGPETILPILDRLAARADASSR